MLHHLFDYDSNIYKYENKMSNGNHVSFMHQSCSHNLNNNSLTNLVERPIFSLKKNPYIFLIFDVLFCILLNIFCIELHN